MLAWVRALRRIWVSRLRASITGDRQPLNAEKELQMKNFEVVEAEGSWNSIEVQDWYAEVRCGKEWWEKSTADIVTGCCIGRLTGVKLG